MPRDIADSQARWRGVSGAGAAILVIVGGEGEVVFANEFARKLAAGATLPVSFVQWCAAAGLPTIAERLRIGDEHPLFEAAPRLWVTSTPLNQLDQMTDHYLVILLKDSSREEAEHYADSMAEDLDESIVTSGEQGSVEKNAVAAAVTAQMVDDDLHRMRHDAIIAMDVSFTLADANSPDRALIWTNPAFSRTTGYSFDESVGRNCRFLQGEDTNEETIKAIRLAIEQKKSVTEVILNYRKDGSAFWNEVSISPIFDREGSLVNFVGVQNDVTPRILLEMERERALAAEKKARTASEISRSQTRLLARVGDSLSGVSRPEGLESVLRLLVTDGGVTCAAILVNDGQALTGSSVTKVPTTPDPVLKSVTFDPTPIWASKVRLPQPTLGAELPPETVRQLFDRHLHTVAYSLNTPQRHMGFLIVGYEDHPQTDRPDEATREQSDKRELLQIVSSRITVWLDVTRLYRQQQELAEKLQMALLPDLPAVPQLDVWGYYQPSSDGAKIGGDWYDVIPLTNGRSLAAIGDVVGHDIDAATSMGRLRSVLQSYALESSDPGELLHRLDQAIARLKIPRMATAAITVIDHTSMTLTYACAGHPPPLLRRRDGEVLRLDEASSPMLGISGTRRRHATISLKSRDALLLYTDGLIETRGQALRLGLESLERRLRDTQPRNAAFIGQALTPPLEARLEDDAAMLVTMVHSGSTSAGGDESDTATSPSPTPPPQGDLLWERTMPANYTATGQTRAAIIENCRTIFPHANEQLLRAAAVALSELLTNAVRHTTTTQVTLTVTQFGSAACFAVTDSDPTPPHLRNVDQDAESGRGIFFIDTTATSWGWNPTRTGKTVWALMPL